MAYAWAELAVAVTYKPTDAAFHFDNSLLSESANGQASRGFLVQFATQVMHWQHRTHFYMVCLTRQHARLLRWDRAGALVSEPINLLEHPEQLLNFIHGFAQMSAAERGRDSAAILVEEGSEEFRRFRDFEPATDWARKCHKEVFADTSNFPIYKVGLYARPRA